MPTIFAQSDLRQLRTGDRLKYLDTFWQVADFSTYADSEGYQTEEWLLKSRNGLFHYLLREIDPAQPTNQEHWYIARQIPISTVHRVDGSKVDRDSIYESIRDRHEPYPELQVNTRFYRFESATSGTYRPDADEMAAESRMTWDYWDAAHQWNLAFEAWTDGTVDVYSTQTVKPQEFSQITRAANSEEFTNPDLWQWYAASFLVLIGILILVFAAVAGTR